MELIKQVRPLLASAEQGSNEMQRWTRWLERLEGSTAICTPVFEVDFNLEYWSCRLFGGSSKELRKLHEVRSPGGEVVGRIEVGAYAGQNLEPFDRLIMLVLTQLWYDQGADGQGRIAFSYRELFRRLGSKAGGRQAQQVKDSLDRLRRCFITLTDCFVTRDESGGVRPVEAEADPFTILKLKQTATIGKGPGAQRFVVCQLSPVVLSGMLEPGRLRPRVRGEILRKLRAKHATSILLHGYYNGRLSPGESSFFDYESLGRELGMQEKYRSNLINRLLPPHEKLEEFGAIEIVEEQGARRGGGLTVRLLAGDESALVVPMATEPTRVAVGEEENRDQLALFAGTRAVYDEQLLLAFRAAGVKNIRLLLKRYGQSIEERELWALLENVRGKNADEKWEWRRGPDAYVAKCLNDGFYVPEGYVTPKERFAEVQREELERRERLETQRLESEARLERARSRVAALSADERVALEDEAVTRLLNRSQGFRRFVKRKPEAEAIGELDARYEGLTNTLVREAYQEVFDALVLEHAA